MKLNDFSVKIAGLAGDGSLLTGEMIAYTLKRRGLYVVSVRDFPSNIRGLPTNLTIRASIERIYSWNDNINALVAFEPKAVNLYLNELDKKGVLIIEETFKSDDIKRDDISIYPVPLRKKAREIFKNEIYKNTIALGFLGFTFGIEFDEIKETLIEKLKGKSEEIVKNNMRAFEEGFKMAEKTVTERFEIVKSDDPGRYFISGNEAIALGALAAGCRFFAAYPITPSTEVFEFLSKHISKYGGITVQCEDEIASINMAIGASFAGLRAMTSTSGPGMALKTEALSMAYMSETPLVIYHAQRGGPSSGTPTKTGQEDINHILFAGHGDVARVILVPSTPEESFDFTFRAFNIAEKYQIPVIVFSEQAISQNQQTIDDIPYNEGYRWERGKVLSDEEVLEYVSQGKKYERYELTEDGISRRAFPGQKGIIVRQNSYEHAPDGFIDEDNAFRIQMVEKRLKKLEKIIDEVPEPEYYGDKNSPYLLIGMGSSLGAMKEACDRLKEEGVNIAYLRIRTLFPLHEDYIYDITKDKEKIFICELNSFGQLKNYLSRIWGRREGVYSIKKYSGLPFRPIEIIKEIKENLKKEN